MTGYSKRNDCASYSTGPVKRLVRTKHSLRKSALADALDEATSLLFQPLSLYEVDLGTSIPSGSSPLQPTECRRRMMRRGSKCPLMFLKDAQADKTDTLTNLFKLQPTSHRTIRLLLQQQGSKISIVRKTECDSQPVQEGAKAA